MAPLSVVKLCPRLVALALGAAAILSIVAACGTDAVGVQQCRDIENARCQRAAACGISLALPVHQGNDIDACIRFYNDQCLHGLLSSQLPGQTDVSACITAMNSSCSYVRVPQTAPACAFLIPIPDAGSDAAGTDASDASVD